MRDACTNICYQECHPVDIARLGDYVCNDRSMISCEACNRDVTFENVFKFEKYLSGKIVNLIGERAGCISFRLDIFQNG